MEFTQASGPECGVEGGSGAGARSPGPGVGGRREILVGAGAGGGGACALRRGERTGGSTLTVAIRLTVERRVGAAPFGVPVRRMGIPTLETARAG